MFETSEINIKKLTYSDYAGLNDGIRYELIKGELYMSPAPTIFHQNSSLELTTKILKFVKENSLGWVFEAPTDVILDEYNTVQPDILFIAKENLAQIHENAIYGPPGLIVEIISPSSLISDRYTKKELYEKAGVREYWIVDLANKTIELFELVDSIFVLSSHVSEKGKIHSKLLNGFEVDIDDIMPEFKF